MGYVESASGLLLPATPVNRCRICGSEFPIEQDSVFLRHVQRCAVKHEDELEAERVERETPMFDHDEEHYEWLRAGRGT